MPALIAEGFAKRYQAKAWHKYLEDVLGEINEILHHLDVCLDVYSEYINQETIKETRNLYEIAGKQVYRLKESWKDFHEKRN
jgi:four helix bundle protein